MSRAWQEFDGTVGWWNDHGVYENGHWFAPRQALATSFGLLAACGSASATESRRGVESFLTWAFAPRIVLRAKQTAPPCAERPSLLDRGPDRQKSMVVSSVAHLWSSLVAVLSEKRALGPASSWLPRLVGAARVSKASELYRAAEPQVAARSIACRKKQVAQWCTRLVACL